MTAEISMNTLPFFLIPSDEGWHFSGGSLRVSAAPVSDLFVYPGTTGENDADVLLNATRALGSVPDGDFQLTARVEADLTAQFDAGALLLWLNDDHWAKLCYELTPDDDRMVVSVVNRHVCDDANASVVNGSDVWLRISRVGKAFVFHSSRDGERWSFVRIFALGEAGQVQIGFTAQSPTGEGCDVRFHDVRFVSETLANLRDGS